MYQARIRTSADLGIVIRERRRQLGLDQRTLASRAGVSRQWLIAVEKGKPGAEVGLLLRTLKVLGLNLHVETGGTPTQNGLDLPKIDLNAVIARARGKPV